MFPRPKTMMAIWLAAAVLVLPQELSAAQPSLSCKYQNGEVTIFETGAAKAKTGCNCGASLGKESITLRGSSPLPASLTEPLCSSAAGILIMGGTTTGSPRSKHISTISGW
jgi:hypothetical protein